MSKKWLYLLVVAVLVMPMILTACGATEAPAPTEEPKAEEPTAAPAEPEPTEAPAEPEPTEAPAEPEPTAEPEEPAAEGPYEGVDPTGATVLWWHQHTKERQEGLNEMVEEFNANNEWGIEVIAEYAGGYGEIYDKMINAIAADDPTLMPNLTVGYANQVAKYQLAEALVDMDYFVDSAAWGLTAEEIADFPQGIFEADVSPVFGDGHFRMAFPPNRSMEVMYYNQDWIEELGYDGPPTTWAEFAEMACAATDADAGTVGYEISTDASRFASLVFSRHGSYFLEDGNFDFTNDTVNETMSFMKDLYDQGCISLIAESYGDQTDFGNYKTLFTIGSSSGLPYYDSAVKSGEQGEFTWGVTALPYMDGGDEPVMNLYGASVTVPKTTPEQELAAWLFTKWFTEPEQNARWAKISGYFPVRKSAADSMTDYMDANPVYKDAFELMPFSTYEAQWCACYEEVRRSMNEAYSSILDGADIDATLAQLQEDASASLAENLPGSPPPQPKPTEAPEEEEPAAEGPYDAVDPTGTTVLWWHQHTKERQEGLNEMVEEFNANNEWGIEVVAEYAGGYGEIYDKMINAIAADDPTLMPNLTVGYANQVAKYQLTDSLVDMDYFVDSATWGLTDQEIADFPQGIFEADVSPVFGDGHFRMAFPPNRSMEALYYNQDWIEELGYDGPPTTWDEFAEMACAATDADAGTVGYEISTDASRFSSMVFSRHGSYFLEDGSSFDFTNDTVKESMSFIKDLYDQGCVTLIAESYGDQTDFGNYKTLFTIGSTSGLPYYDSAVKSGEQGEFVWGVTALPYMDGGDEPVMNLYGASVTVPKTTPEQELAAWLFVKWFTEPEQNARWAKISGYFPVRKSAADNMTDYMDANPVYKDAFELMPFSTYEAQWCACYEEVRRMMNEAYSSILDGADIEATLSQLQEDANASLAENTP